MSAAPEGLEDVRALLIKNDGALISKPEVRKVIEQYLHTQESRLLIMKDAMETDSTLTEAGKKILRRELKTALLRNSKAVHAVNNGMATGSSVLPVLDTANVEQMLFEASFAKLASPSSRPLEQPQMTEQSSTDLGNQQLNAPQYGDAVTDLAREQQEAVDNIAPVVTVSDTVLVESAPVDEIAVVATAKKPRVKKKPATETLQNESKAAEDPEVRKFFEEEYYRLRDTHQLPLEADGNVLGPDEYVASKIAELEALTPAGAVISIPDATKKEALTALQKSIGAERERLAQAPITDDAPDVDTDATAAPGTALALSGVRKRLGSLQEKLIGEAPNDDAEKLSATQLYEIRAQGIAEKNGMGDHFKEVRFIRQAYIDARAAIGKDADKDKVKELKLAYDRALYGWNTELSSKAGKLTGLDRAELLIVSKRDTILGPAHAEAEARERALTEKGKTAFGKVQNWATQAPLAVLKGLNFVPTVIGKGIAGVFNRDTYQPNAKMSPEKFREIAAMTPKQREALSDAAQQDAARHYARAARIIAGAGIATLVSVAFTPAAGVLLPFVVFSARGAGGTLLGMGGAKGTGMGFNFLNRNRRAKLKDFTSATPIDLETYQAQQKAYRKNNTFRRSNEKIGYQMLGAIVVGGGTGILSSGISHSILEHFGGLSSVKEAAKTVADVNAHSPGAGPEAMRVGAAVRTVSEHQPLAPAHTATVVPEASVAPKAPEVAPVSTTTAPTAPSVAGAVVKTAEAAPVRVSVPNTPEGLLTSVAINKPGEGFGQLLVDLRSQVSGLQNPPAGLKHFLEQNPNALTHRLGVADGGGSLRMHAGDKLFIDTKQNVWLQAQGQDHPTLVFQKVPVSADAPDGYHVEHLDIKKFGGELQPDTVRPRAPEARVVNDAPAAPRAATVPTEDPSAALNRAQIGGRALDADTAGAQPDDVAASGDTQTSPVEQAVTQAPKPPVAVTAEHPVAPASAAEQSVPVPPTAPVDALPQDMTPFTNSHGVNIVPSEPRVYALPGQRLVIWGTDSFKKQLDTAYAFIAEQRELGKHATVLLERTRENPFTGARETTMYEFNTDVEALKEFPPDELPIKPFGAKDFVPK